MESLDADSVSRDGEEMVEDVSRLVDDSSLFLPNDDDETVPELGSTGVPFEGIYNVRRVPEEERCRIQRSFEQTLIRQLVPDIPRVSKGHESADLVAAVASSVTHGMRVITKDTFWKCFQSKESPAWNWNVYLYPLWLLGVLLRYFVLCPLRILLVVVGSVLWWPLFLLAGLDPNARRRRAAQAFLGRLYAFIWIMSFCGVITTHGRPPLSAANELYVANHTSLIDVIVLLRVTSFALVGQRHGGLAGFFQKFLFSAMDPIWFERSELSQRATVKRRLKEHIVDPASARLLLFPEGTCVNNEYCVMFKKGAFELGARVVPIAMKYNKIFADCHYNSRRDSFVSHLLRLWTSWACVCEVWFLEPMTQREDESPVQFAGRVKRRICRKARLIDVPWDGMFKYVKPSERFTVEWQKLYASQLLQSMAKETAIVH